MEGLPWGPVDERVPAGIETTVPAETVRGARGRVVEEVVVKREGGGVRRVVVGRLEEGEGEGEVVEIKEEPVD